MSAIAALEAIKANRRDLIALTVVAAVGAGLAYVDHRLSLHTLLVEGVHALVVTGLFIACLWMERRTPEIRQFGWRMVVLGLGLLAMGSWVDMLDDPPTLHLLEIHGVPFGRSWEQAFLKKILGYTVGIALLGVGFLQWAPWMIRTRRNVADLNRELSRLLTSLDARVEAERLALSRELHDDLAQRLTFLGYQAQICQKALNDAPPAPQTASIAAPLTQMSRDLGDALKTVRRLSQDLRPESLDALGLLPALEEFLDKQRRLTPLINFATEWRLRAPGSLEAGFSDQARLHLFRVAQEAVRNAVKHSEASRITLSLTEDEAALRLRVSDDGRGFPWAQLPSDEALLADGHLGLVGLQERVRELGGSLRLGNEPSGRRGAFVEATFPR